MSADEEVVSVERVDPAAVDPVEFARLVRDSSADELSRLMSGGRRDAVLRKIFGDMPAVFRPENAGSTDAVIHWVVGGRPGGGEDVFELVVAGGTCRLSQRPGTRPRVTMTVGPVDWLRLVTGNANPVTLFMRGRLRAKGDLGLALRIPALFEPPRP